MSKILAASLLVINQEIKKLEAKHLVALRQEKELRTAILELNKMINRAKRNDSEQ